MSTTKSKSLISFLLSFLLIPLSTHAMDANCPAGEGRVSILSNDFPALHAIADFAEQCVSDKSQFSKNQTTKHRDIQVASLTASPAEYTVAVVANSSIVPLLNNNLIRPLDDLVAKYGKSLKKNQLIRIDGKIMAVALWQMPSTWWFEKISLRKWAKRPPLLTKKC